MYIVRGVQLSKWIYEECFKNTNIILFLAVFDLRNLQYSLMEESDMF